MFIKPAKKIITSFLFLAVSTFWISAQEPDRNVEQRLKDFFTNFETSYANIGKCRLDRYELNHSKKALHVYANANFGYQPFTPENTEAIYRLLKQSLPGPVNYYDITIYADGKPIEELIPNILQKKQDKSRLWQRIDYKGAPWVQNMSRPYLASKGLEGRHIALWQSHGKYYKNNKGSWEWQRPRLFCTTEDLFTQSFVVPYIIPMLENAGAVVYTPRERDRQRNEVIVDNNTVTGKSIYLEEKSRKGKWKTSPLPGFARKRSVYTDGQNPFRDGTARFAATEKKPEKAFAQWIPDIPETGKYAVYVSYQTLPGSVSDAKYLVFHKGGVTEFKVNQQMGGGTWVYLGTFEFDKGTNDYGMVVLSNESKQKGVVCADAVRFGGGMGNISRGGSISGLPRYLEGARYAAQWAGMPYGIYSPAEGKNDYTDDINSRSRVINYMSGGSVYNPQEQGLGVPFEMTFGLHSDAGFSKEDELIGTLGIYTTGSNNGKLNAGISRYASRDLADMVLTGLQRDISAGFGIQWPRRSLWNRNYSETRLPGVPSMILELLSHQNFADLKLGHNPRFKFTVARSVYKSILKYTATMHGTDYVVQPLPVSNFSIAEGSKKNTFRLSWQAVDDPLEPTAKAREYIVYTRLGHGGFDNGTLVRDTKYTFEAEPGLVYSFKVTAVNRGGESFPSETVSLCRCSQEKGTVMVINGFDRISAPDSFEIDTVLAGFDTRKDFGVPYLYDISFIGEQYEFRRNIPWIDDDAPGFGASRADYETRVIAGNTFDYPYIHGRAITNAGYSFLSASDEAVTDQLVALNDYRIVDLILGKEKQVKIGRGVTDRAFKTFPESLQTIIADYCENGGNIFVSGAYVATDLWDNGDVNETDKRFANEILHYTWRTGQASVSGQVKPAASPFPAFDTLHVEYHNTLNENCYAVESPDGIEPFGKGSYTIQRYGENNIGAGIFYRGQRYNTCIFDQTITHQ